MEKSQIKKKKVHHRVWFTMALATVLVVAGVIYTYYYYKPPTYKYPKIATTYTLDRKFDMTVDGVVVAFLKSVYENDPDLCRNVVPSRIFELYGVYYYHGVFNDEKVKYLLTNVNNSFKEQYGDDWFDNLKITGIDKKEFENSLATGKIIGKVGDKDFKFEVEASGFDDRYSIDMGSLKPVFDPLLKDESKRPPE